MVFIQIKNGEILMRLKCKKAWIFHEEGNTTTHFSPWINVRAPISPRHESINLKQALLSSEIQKSKTNSWRKMEDGYLTSCVCCSLLTGCILGSLTVSVRYSETSFWKNLYLFAKFQVLYLVAFSLEILWIIQEEGEQNNIFFTFSSHYI